MVGRIFSEKTFGRTAAATILLIAVCQFATALAQVESRSNLIVSAMTACAALNNSGAGIIAFAQNQRLSTWTPTQIAQIAPIRVITPFPIGQDKPPISVPMVALHSDIVRAWWLDAERRSSLTYQEAQSPRMGGGKLVVEVPRRWRSCRIDAEVQEARSAFVGALTLSPKPIFMVGKWGKSLDVTLISREDPLPGLSSDMIFPSSFSLRFDQPIIHVNAEFKPLDIVDTDAASDPASPVQMISRSELLKVLERPAALIFDRETGISAR